MRMTGEEADIQQLAQLTADLYGAEARDVAHRRAQALLQDGEDLRSFAWEAVAAMLADTGCRAT